MRREITLVITYNEDGEGVWCVEYEKWGCVGCGETFIEALRSFVEDVVDTMADYQVTEDWKLSKKALEIKRDILSFWVEVSK